MKRLSLLEAEGLSAIVSAAPLVGDKKLLSCRCGHHFLLVAVDAFEVAQSFGGGAALRILQRHLANDLANCSQCATAGRNDVRF